jgi:TatD DNase family protein
VPEITPHLIDYHCHLDLYPDYEEQFRACTKNQIATLAVTTTPRAWPRNKELASTSPMVRVGIGFHPQLVGEHGRELYILERYLPETRYVGEVGLDAGPVYYKSYAQQKTVFETILRLCAQAGGKILSVHSVRATRDVLQMIEDHLTGTTNRVVLHWFTGSASEARRAAELGCYFSINQSMLQRPTAAALIAAMPGERLLTETDGPFTKAVGRPTVPSDVAKTVESLATLLTLSTGETRNLLCFNLTRLETRP